MTQKHTFIRCGNQIYREDAPDQWRTLHNFETEKRAKRWQRDQEKQRPGSVTVGTTPPRVVKKVVVNLARDRLREIARLITQQVADRARDYHVKGQGLPRGHTTSIRPAGLSGKTAQLAQTYVAPDRDGSSSSQKPSKKRALSRNGKNTRASFGDS